MIQWEVFFLYYHDTDDVDHDYGDYYDDVHEPLMYSFRWIVIVMVIMLQNYKKRWLNILWRSFLSVLAKQTKKKKLLLLWCACTEFYESFPLTIRGDIHTDSSKYLGSKRVFRYPMIKYDDKRFISQLMNMNWKLFETELNIFGSKNRVIQIRVKRPFIDPCKWLISVLWVFLHLINMDCHEIFPFPFGDSWRRNLIQTDGSEKRETNQGQNVHSLGKCNDMSFPFQLMIFTQKYLKSKYKMVELSWAVK